MGYSSCSNEEARAKVKAGFKGGNTFFKNPIKHPAMTIVDGVPSEVKASLKFNKPASVKIEDPWYGRRG